MTFSLLNIRVRSQAPAPVQIRFATTVTGTEAGTMEKEKMPVMHWTLLYSGMQYQNSSSWAPLPNMEETPSSITPIIRGLR